MFYQITEENAVDYIKKTKVYKEILNSANDLKCEDLALGNINLIFRIYSEADPKNSVILKQALTYARKYPEFKLPQERAYLEADVLKIENEYCPDAAPHLYLYDEEMYINLMEDANDHLIMRDGLMRQIYYPKFPKQMGVFLARTLFYTSIFFLPADVKKDKVVRFTNKPMCKITEDLIFTQPWMDHPDNHWTEPFLDPVAEELQNNAELRRESLKLKEAFMNHTEALIHGDLHTGSIMINPEQIKVIDPEFGFYGPMGFDIGAVIGNLVLSYASQEYHAKEKKVRQEYQQWILDTIKGVWVEFEKEFRKLWKEKRLKGEWESDLYLEDFLKKTMQDSIGFGGCKIVRRLFGLAHVPDMWEIPEDRSRAVCESMAYNAGKQWVLQHETIASIDEAVSLIKDFAIPHPSLQE